MSNEQCKDCAAMSAIITCQNASFGYDGHIVVSGLNFTVEDADYLCIAGENGSGKSTLVKGLLQLIKPMGGTITYSAELGRVHHRDAIGYLSQASVVKKDFPAGVYETVLSGNVARMGLRPFYFRKEKQAAQENMKRLGIADLKERCYRELSGGQQRRVLLARALCAISGVSQTQGERAQGERAQKVLVLDEPAAGLDPLAAGNLYDLLKNINQELGITIIMVSHDVEAAMMYAKHILHLDQGHCFFGVTAEYRVTDFCRQFTGGNRNEQYRYNLSGNV
jgi:zinc transport system ATP-binding protein